MKIKHCIAQKKDFGPLIIKINSKDSPDESLYYKRHSEGMSWGDFLFKEWKNSFNEYPVVNEQEWVDYLALVAPFDSLEKGIPIVDLSRVSIENICCQTGIRCGYPCNGEENCEKNKYAILLPEKEIEDEEKLWREVDQILGNKAIESLIKMEKLLGNFEIKRKDKF